MAQNPHLYQHKLRLLAIFCLILPSLATFGDSPIMKNYQAPIDLLKDRVILVTGASQGIGRTTALSFAAHGATVILLGRKVEKLEAVYDEIEAQGSPQPAIFSLDLEKATDLDLDNFAGAIRQQLGRLDGILHNASQFYSLTPLEYQTLEQWLSLLRVNLAVPFALTRACLPLLKAAPDASVVMTLETHAQQPAAFWGGFAVSKSGLAGLISIWAQEWEALPHLRINGIIPGPIQSPQRAKTHPGELKSALPLPEAIMPHYLYLMGKESSGMSGQIIACQ